MSGFTFKQFHIAHDQCAMKVGTDGVLLGAWAKVEDARRILDIGCGSALIALMVAQRALKAHVWGIDIDSQSIVQAKENVVQSPFSTRVTVEEGDIHHYQTTELFDHIICNPPFYTEHTLPPNEARMYARNTCHLTLEELLIHVERLLTNDGYFSLILPSHTASSFTTHALSKGWNIKRICKVHTKEDKPAKRTLLTLSRMPGTNSENTHITLQGINGKRSNVYQELCKDYYLE